MVYERISKKQQFVNFILKKIQKNYFVRFFELQIRNYALVVFYR